MDENNTIPAGGVEQAEPEKNASPVILADAPDIGDDVGEAPVPEMSAEEMEALAGEFEKALHDIGEDQLEPPNLFDIPGYDEAAISDDLPPWELPDEKLTEPQQTMLDLPAAEEKAPEKRGRGGRPPKADRAEKAPEADKPKKADRAPRQPTTPKQEKAAKTVDKAKTPAKEETTPAPPAPEPQQPREAPRSDGKAEVVFISLAELQPFKNHPFGVRDDNEMKALVESVRAGGVNQPALVRPIEGGYEMICGHRRQHASELAGFTNMPCIVREMTDDEAVLAMTDDNLRQRSEILPSEKAVSLKMQVEAISHQGARDTSGQNVQKDAGQRSVDIVGERNNMNARQVQRYMKLTDLVPDLIKMVDEKKIGFTSAVEISFIKPKNQNFIAVAIEGEQSSPSLSQAQRLRELDKEGKLNGDVIDGILGEKKKEELKVVITGKELETYFGKDKTPQQMKGQIIKLLEDWAQKEKTVAPPEKRADKDR